MKCRYCGATNPAGEDRCVKCQRRVLTMDSQPVFQTAAVPTLNDSAATATATAPARPQIVGGTGQATPPRPTQKTLFAFREPEKVITIGELDVPRPGVKNKSAGQRGKTRSSESQEAFDFAPTAPSRPLQHELPRSGHHLVAPLSARAMAAVFDLAFIVAFCAVFAFSVRVTLGQLPVGLSVLPYWAGAFFAVAIVYKLTWCLADCNSPGINLSGLELVSFDGQRPTGSQRVWRFLSGWFSFAAAGMGLVWAIADQDRLTWHDHISQTFLTPWHRQP